MISDPYPPMHPDHVQAYDHLFHSNGGDYNKPTSVSGQHGENFQNKEAYVLQNELFQNNGMENERFVAQNVPFESNSAVNRMEESNLLWPVLPYESGEGLPYAPVDWPYPGDIWTWRVGRRFSSSGYFQDRFLYLPKRLGNRMFSSKSAIVNYFNSYFPGADVDAFFASFAWKIPVKMQSPTKAPPMPPAPPQEEIAANQEQVKAENGHSSLGKRRRTVVASYAPQEIEDDEEQLSYTPRRRKPGRPKLSSPSKSKQTNQSGGQFSSNVLVLGTVEPAPPMPPAPPQEEIMASQEEVRADNGQSSPRKRRRTVVASYAPQETEDDEEQLSSTPKRRKPGRPRLSSSPKRKQTKQSGGRFSSASKKAEQNEAMLSSLPKQNTWQTPGRYSNSVLNYESDMQPIEGPIPEGFENLLSCLEDILNQPLYAYDVPSSMAANSAAAQIEMAEARGKLSSLLVMDFPSLTSPNVMSELTTLASKLRKDPTLSAEQLVKLRLIEEMPMYGEVFRESRELIAQADEFWAGLQAKKFKAAALKNEYGELKEKAEQLQYQVDANSLAVDEIDRQIALLRSKRAEFTNAIETSKVAKAEVTSAQKVVAITIQKLVHEIQQAYSKMPDMELKKRDAVTREAEIRAKLAPLQGFHL